VKESSKRPIPVTMQCQGCMVLYQAYTGFVSSKFTSDFFITANHPSYCYNPYDLGVLS